jgi:pimeloyl-ACP methyl ester carboxylesterase
MSQSTGSVVIVAHSMGGLVARAMLHRHAHLVVPRLRLLQIASPITGSALALYSLQKQVRVSDTLEWVARLMTVISGTTTGRLFHALRSAPSMFALLPHPCVTAAFSATGEEISAFDRRLWLKGDEAHLAEAEAIHAALESPCPIPMLCLYSDSFPTEHAYTLLPDGTIQNCALSYDGDGTVVGSSAYAGTAPEYRLCVGGGRYDHSGICAHISVVESLTDLLQ